MIYKMCPKCIGFIFNRELGMEKHLTTYCVYSYKVGYREKTGSPHNSCDCHINKMFLKIDKVLCACPSLFNLRLYEPQCLHILINCSVLCSSGGKINCVLTTKQRGYKSINSTDSTYTKQ